MRELNKIELNNIKGGISGSVITSIINGAKIIIELGRYLGSSLRRHYSKNYC